MFLKQISMKTKILLFVMGLILTTQLVNAQVPSYVPTNGLVGYWPFNGNANDQSGNGNNGTVNGATLTTDRNGNANSAYSFDGLNDYITIPNSTSLSNMTGITISAWFNINQWDVINNQGWFPILSKTNSFSYGKYRLGANTSVAGEPSIYGNLSTDATGISQNNLYSLNQWNQIVITISNGNSTIALNGVQVFNGVTTFTGWSTIDNLPLLIGNDIPGIEDYANGKIDDIGIWNRALTQQEITNMYDGVTYSETCNAVSGSLVNGLVAYYPFCGNANDQSGNGLNGVVNGAILTSDRFGNSNSAYVFDGNSKIRCAFSNQFSPDASDNYSFSFWAENTSNNFGMILQYYTYNPTENISNYDFFNSLPSCPSGSYAFQNFPFNSPGGCSPTLVNLNEWNHIVVVIKQVEQTFNVFKNGVFWFNGNVGNIKPYAGFLTIGNVISDTFGYNGKIDDIGIWNRALTPQEVTQLFNQNQCINTITVTDTLIINVGQLSYTNPISFANNITIYPNPASTQVNISFNNITDLAGGSIKIINSLGQQVATTPITLSGTNTTMALNSWGGTGLYFVQIVNAQGQIVDIKKIILQ